MYVKCLLQGALTHGDRRATETRDLSRFNFDNKVSTLDICFREVSYFLYLPVTHSRFSLLQYGRNALEIVMKSIVKLDAPLVSPPSNFKGDFFKGTLIYMLLTRQFIYFPFIHSHNLFNVTAYVCQFT